MQEGMIYRNSKLLLEWRLKVLEKYVVPLVEIPFITLVPPSLHNLLVAQRHQHDPPRMAAKIVRHQLPLVNVAATDELF